MSESAAERILALNKQIADLEAQRKKLLGAIGPVHQGYADGKRVPARPLTQMENAAIKRASDIEHRLTPLDEERCRRLAFFLSQTTGRKLSDEDEPESDPEVLLRGSLRTLANLYRELDDESRTPDLRVMLKLLIDYVRSLDEPDEDDDA
jgi:hypothetical protein